MKPNLFLATVAALVLHAGASPPAANRSADDPSDVRGPARYAGLAVHVSPEGLQARAPGPPRDAFKGQPWRGRWITAAGPGDVTLFRKTFTLGAGPIRLAARITSTGSYRLAVNGAVADRGPADSGRDYIGGTSGLLYYNVRDIGFLTHPGLNVITCEVAGGGRLLFEARGHSAAGPVDIASDLSWRATAAPHLRDGGWAFDGRAEPVGWQNPAYLDAGWPAAQPAPAPEGLLRQSDLPPCAEGVYPPINPAATHARITSNAGVQVRFNRIFAGWLSLRVRGTEGTRITLQPNELPRPGATNHPSVITLRTGVQTYETPGFASVGAVNILVSNVTGPVELLDVRACWTSQPVEYLGAFECSDPALGRIWRACRGAVQICLQTWHLDSPQHQEPISDYGDYLIEDRAGFDAFGAHSGGLARQDLRKWARIMASKNYQTFHTSYELLWIQSLAQYARRTGDVALARELAPAVFGVIDTFGGYVGRAGLISEAPNYMFMDWVDIAGFPGHHPPAVIGQGYMTAFYIKALADGAAIARLTGDARRAGEYEVRRMTTVRAFNAELWSPEHGLYRDGKPFQTHVPPGEWLPADRDIETFSAQNNTLAVLYDIAPRERQAGIMRTVIAARPFNMRPYFKYFLLDALDHAGVFGELGLGAIREWKIVPETGTFYEMGDQGDLSHGWIAAPLIALTEHVLGLSPASDGYREASIRPEYCGLAWARGTVDTPAGRYAVSWRREAGRILLEASAPRNGSAVVALPCRAPASAKAMVDGIEVWPRRVGRSAAVPSWSSGRLIFRIREGVHRIELRSPADSRDLPQSGPRRA